MTTRLRLGRLSFAKAQVIFMMFARTAGETAYVGSHQGRVISSNELARTSLPTRNAGTPRLPATCSLLAPRRRHNSLVPGKALLDGALLGLRQAIIRLLLSLMLRYDRMFGLLMRIDRLVKKVLHNVAGFAHRCRF